MSVNIILIEAVYFRKTVQNAKVFAVGLVAVIPTEYSLNSRSMFDGGVYPMVYLTLLINDVQKEFNFVITTVVKSSFNKLNLSILLA